MEEVPTDLGSVVQSSIRDSQDRISPQGQGWDAQGYVGSRARGDRPPRRPHIRGGEVRGATHLRLMRFRQLQQDLPHQQATPAGPPPRKQGPPPRKQVSPHMPPRMTEVLQREDDRMTMMKAREQRR